MQLKAYVVKLLIWSDAVSYMDDDDENGIVSQERPQRRVPVSRDNEDLVVKGNAFALCCEMFFSV